MIVRHLALRTVLGARLGWRPIAATMPFLFDVDCKRAVAAAGFRHGGVPARFAGVPALAEQCSALREKCQDAHLHSGRDILRLTDMVKAG